MEDAEILAEPGGLTLLSPLPNEVIVFGDQQLLARGNEPDRQRNQAQRSRRASDCRRVGGGRAGSADNIFSIASIEEIHHTAAKRRGTGSA